MPWDSPSFKWDYIYSTWDELDVPFAGSGNPGKIVMDFALAGRVAIEIAPPNALVPTFYVGQRPTFRGRFTVNGLPINPTTTTLRIKNPAGTTTTYTYVSGDLTRENTGVFYRMIELSAAGDYRVSFEGTGACEAVSVVRFTVYATGA